MSVAGRVLSFFDKDREPLRRRVYSTLATVLAIAVGAGLITGEDAAALYSVAGALLLIPATESARQFVTPVQSKHRRAS